MVTVQDILSDFPHKYDSERQHSTDLTKAKMVTTPYEGEPVSCIPELTALDPDLALQQEKKARKARRRQ